MWWNWPTGLKSYLLELSKISGQGDIKLGLQEMYIIHRTILLHRVWASRSVQLREPGGCDEDPVVSPAEQLKVGHPGWKTFRDKPKNILWYIRLIENP